MTPNTLANTWTGTPPVDRVAAPLREQVIDALRAAILDFRLSPGQRLVERELIEELGVSRTTVREALRELTSEGLVSVVPQRGAVVSAPSLDEAVDLYDVRGALECVLVERFTERADEAQIDRLNEAVDGFAAAAEEGRDIRQVLDAKDVFYRVLIEGAGSAALQQLIEGIQARVRMLRATSMSEGGRATIAATELRSVAEAIARRDGSTAKERYLTHIHNAAETALLHLRKAEASAEG